MPPTSPSDDLLAQRVREARSAAVDAGLEADALEAKARRARRLANSKMQHYESLLLELQGQMTLEEE